MGSENLETSPYEIIGFHLPSEDHGCLSNWYHSDFVYAGIQYTSVEQYMMAQKVSLGNRYDLRKEIMESYDPQRIKELGGKDYFYEYGTVEPVWETIRRQIVKRGVKAKFKQNHWMLKELLETGDAILAECAANDRIWGIGINLSNPQWKDASNWRGENYLGQILMEVREELKKEIYYKKAVQYIDFHDAEPIPVWKLQVKELIQIPSYYNALYTYYNTVPFGRARDRFLNSALESTENAMRINMGGGFPVAGFYEMKQEVYEIYRDSRLQPYLSDVFREKPESWGLQGDPYFWKTLEEKFAFDDISLPEEEINEKIAEVFKEKTGEELSEDKQCYVKEFAQNGLSSGYVSGEWVINTCIPLVKERLEKLK